MESKKDMAGQESGTAATVLGQQNANTSIETIEVLVNQIKALTDTSLTSFIPPSTPSCPRT